MSLVTHPFVKDIVPGGMDCPQEIDRAKMEFPQISGAAESVAPDDDATTITEMFNGIRLACGEAFGGTLKRAAAEHVEKMLQDSQEEKDEKRRGFPEAGTAGQQGGQNGSAPRKGRTAKASHAKVREQSSVARFLRGLIWPQGRAIGSATSSWTGNH